MIIFFIHVDTLFTQCALNHLARFENIHFEFYIIETNFDT